jgi:hypothetical protein
MAKLKPFSARHIKYKVQAGSSYFFVSLGLYNNKEMNESKRLASWHGLVGLKEGNFDAH